MATRASARIWKGSPGLTSSLSHAVLEWLLIFLLFVDALFSYLVKKFAEFCQLQTPCPLCSRIDHVIDSEKPGFYRSLFCHAHKLEISSLAYCHVHEKLDDVHDMCEGCFLSFATESKSNAETYQSLVGTLWPNHLFCNGVSHDDHFNQMIDADSFPIMLHPKKQMDPLLENPVPESLESRQCSCCGMPFRTRQQIHHRLKLFNSISCGTTQLDDATSMDLKESCHLHQWRSFTKKMQKPYKPAALSYLRTDGLDPLSHVGYTELKITSDSESEAANSEGCDGNTIVCQAGQVEDEVVDRSIDPESSSSHRNVRLETYSADLSEEKLINQAPKMEPSESILLEQPHTDEQHGILPLPSDVVVGHGLEDLHWRQVGESVSVGSTGGMSTPAIPLSSNEMNAPTEGSGELNALRVIDTTLALSTDSKEVLEMENQQASVNTGSNCAVKNERVLSTPSSMDLNEAYEVAIGIKRRQFSGVGQRTVKGASQIQEDLKALLSQLTAAQGLELSWNDASPRIHIGGDDFKVSVSSGSIGQQILHKRISLERNESGFESLDGSIVSEIEGESEIDHLKRQVELDRKSMRALYKELEEERSASAIAANQAMAMITRLQEEKAAMHMEALQYQRMMEEQAEYDQEALQKLNELLTQREHDIQALEEELNTYKVHDNVSLKKNVLGPLADSKRDCSNLSCSCSCGNTHSDCNSIFIGPKHSGNSEKKNITNEVGVRNNSGDLKDSLIDIENEKLYITKCLKRLEKLLHLFSKNGIYLNMSELDGIDGHLIEEVNEDKQILSDDNGDPNTGFYEKEMLGDMVHLHSNGIIQGFDRMELVEEDLSLERTPSPYEDGLHAKSNWDAEPINTDSQNQQCNRSNAFYTSGDTDLVTLKIEVSHLNQRLVTLAADCNFLGHTINSLRSETRGLQFVQEIANHLKELRRIGVMRN